MLMSPMAVPAWLRGEFSIDLLEQSNVELATSY